MKKFLLTLLGAAALTAGAQNYQFENAGFEDGFASSGEAYHWHGFKSASGTLASSAPGTFAQSTDVRSGATGTYSVVATAGSVFTVIGNGTFTNGRLNAGSMTATNTANHSEMSLTNTNTDKNGDPFYTKINGQPDTLKVWLKFTQGTANSSYPYATVSTIITDGTYYQDPEDKTYTNVLAKAQNKTITTCDWTQFAIPFDYDSYASNGVTVDAEHTGAILITISTNASAGKGSKNDKIYADDLELVYSSYLKSATYDGTAITIAKNMTVDATYDASKLALTLTGKGATYDTSYDESTAKLTITVKGNDISANSTNYHTYTVQFAKPAATLTSATVGGVKVTEFTKVSDTEYKATLPIVYNQGLVAEGTPADGGTMVKDATYEALGITEYGFYDNTAKTITLKVKNADDVETSYVFSFTEPVTTSEILGNYPGALSVVLGANGETIIAPLANATITLTQNQNGTYNIALPNFSFAMMSMLVGDIYVPGLTLADNKLTATAVTIRLASDNDEAIGAMLGHLPVTIDLTLDDKANKYADASIDIITTDSEVEMVKMFSTIHVDYVPFQVDESATTESDGSSNSAYLYQTLTGYVSKAATKFLHLNETTVGTPMQYLDMSGATIASGVTATDLKQGALATNNTFYYLPESATTLSGTNIVVGNTAQSVAIADAVGINIPKGFTAGRFDYDRVLTAGRLTTFVLPFTTAATNIDGTVYKLTGLTTDAFEFEEVTDYVAENTPYVVVPNGTSLFKTSNTGGSVATANAETEAKLVLSGITHQGTYGEAETLTSTTVTTYYGYAGSEFKKASTGTLNRYRTAFAVDATPPTPSAPAYRFQTGTTGITGAQTEAKANAKAYDLQGRRVGTVGKGVYVVNGMKVIK